MIRYALKCTEDHAFESWFKSAEAFDALRGTAMLSCPVCGSGKVEKAIMAPRVRPSRGAAAVPAEPVSDGPLRATPTDAEKALAEIRRKVEENSDYVGPGFATEARRMHAGETPHRSIYGEARADEARQLIEDGIPVAPLPFIPQRKTN